MLAMEPRSLHMLNKSFPTELLSSAHSRKNLRNGIGYTSHEVAESQTGRRFSINREHTIPETREKMVLLELKAWGLLKEHGSKVDLLPQEAGPQTMSLQKKPPQGKRENSLASLSPVTYSLTSLCAAESPLRPAA